MILDSDLAAIFGDEAERFIAKDGWPDALRSDRRDTALSMTRPIWHWRTPLVNLRVAIASSLISFGQEDFCQLSNRSEETAGRNYKYDSSYEEVGRILKQFCKAYPVEIEKLFE